MATRLVHDHHLRVAPQLLGLALASPARRVAAILVDGLVLALPTLAVALAAAAFDLWRDPNRQLPHDRTVHTVVVRAPRRRARTTAKPAPNPPLETADD